MLRRFSLVLLAVASLSLPLAAAAPVLAQNPLQQPVGPLVSGPDQTTTVTTAPKRDTGNGGGLSHLSEILMSLGGVALITFIGWAIVRDARKAAPVAEDQFAADGPRTGGTHVPKARTKAQRRAKAKAQRAARRHNR